MKAKRALLIGLILGGVIGWFLGYLHLPYIEKIPSFLTGFIACVVLVMMLFAFLFAWKKHSSLLRSIDEESTKQNLKTATKNYALIWIVAAAFIIAGALLSGFLIHQQNKFMKTQLQKQDTKIQEQSELMQSVRKSNMVILLNDILDKVDNELENHPDGKLSDNIVASIAAAFNYSFTPYRYLEGDSLSEKRLSPEKGQLLLELCTKNIDSTTFDKIKRSSHFSGADLKKGDLHGVDLSGADLNGADLSDADLNGAILKGADLRNAKFSGAHVNKANLIDVDARRADLSWAELNGTQLDSANLNGADLSNAQLRNADLRKATFYAAKLDGALLNEANLEGVYLVDASLKKANLTRVILTNAYVNRANFSGAIMTGTQLAGLTNVDKDWFKKLNGWHILEAKEIQKNYKIVVYTVIDDVSWYRLEKK